jgi:NAD(P)H-dependent FMN reductase
MPPYDADKEPDRPFGGYIYDRNFGEPMQVYVTPEYTGPYRRLKNAIDLGSKPPKDNTRQGR